MVEVEVENGHGDEDEDEDGSYPGEDMRIYLMKSFRGGFTRVDGDVKDKGGKD